MAFWPGIEERVGKEKGMEEKGEGGMFKPPFVLRRNDACRDLQTNSVD